MTDMPNVVTDMLNDLDMLMHLIDNINNDVYPEEVEIYRPVLMDKITELFNYAKNHLK